MSTSLRIASTPAADLGHQPLVRATNGGHDAELGGAGLRGLLGRLDQARDVQPRARTGESNRPDWEQKWQSSGQPPVLRLMMPSTSTSGPHQCIRTSWPRPSNSSRRSSSSRRTASIWSWLSPSPPRTPARGLPRGCLRHGRRRWWVELPLESPSAPLHLCRVRVCGHIRHNVGGSLNETVFKSRVTARAYPPATWASPDRGPPGRSANQMFDALVAVPAAQTRRSCPSICDGRPAMRSARPSWTPPIRRARVTCAVHWPGRLLAIGAGTRCGRHSRCTSACSASSSAVGTTSRAKHRVGPAEQQRRADRGEQRKPGAQRPRSSSTSAAMRSATVSVACGRLAGA